MTAIVILSSYIHGLNQNIGYFYGRKQVGITVRNTGDIFKTGVDTALYMEDFFLGAKDLIANIPIFLAIGNHEYGGDPDARATKKYFAFPENQTWYQMKYGTAHFLFLDSTKLLYKWDGTERVKKSTAEIANDEQLRWLEKILIAPKPQWRIVVLHHHIFSQKLPEETRGITRRKNEEIKNLYSGWVCFSSITHGVPGLESAKTQTCSLE